MVRAVATAMAQGNDFVAAHPNRSLSIIDKLWPRLPPAVLQASLQHLTCARDGLQSAALWRNAEAVARLTGLTSKPVPLAAGTDWTNACIDRASLSG